MKLATSILSIKDNIKENISIIDKTNTDYIHLDIMDGKFVINKTMPFKEVHEYIKDTSKCLDIHIMVKNVKSYIDKYSLLNPEIITFHLEATSNPKEIVDYIKSKNIKAGISIKPDTKLERLGNLLKYVDLVLVMTVEPGCGGQEFIESTAIKIDKLKLLRNAYGYKYLIEADGGINDKTSVYCNNADILVVGSYITNSSNYQERMDIIRRRFQ